VGPNGGYVAAIVLRAVVAETADPTRRPISATFHYLRPPTEGEVEIEVTVERAGRSVSNVSARMTQDGRLLVLALVAVGAPREGAIEFDETDGLPRALDGSEVPRWSDIDPAPIDPERDIPMRSRYEMRWGFGATPFAGEPGSVAVTGGWLRLKESPEVDEMVLVAMADAWMPPVFSRVGEQLAVPTVDLTVHFRGRPSDTRPGAAADGPDAAWCFVRFASPVARHGYLVEHGSVWDSAGRLLADVRQLAVVM
jgi:acyl-CoA thioesterase